MEGVANLLSGRPSRHRSLSSRNVLFYNLYRTAKLTGRWPRDGWFLYLARIVSEVEQQCQEAKQLAATHSSVNAQFSNLL
jgi:hypothetical protein